jgi:hypothetical protein
MVDKITSVITSPQGEISLIQRFSNYKAVNGVKFPGKLVIEQNGIIITMDNMVYTVNDPIDDSEFKLD